MNYLDKLYELLNDYGKDIDNEIEVFTSGIVNDVVLKYAAPQYDKNYLSSLTLEVVRQLTNACELKGFRQGLRHALKLIIETQHTPPKSSAQSTYELEEILANIYNRKDNPNG